MPRRCPSSNWKCAIRRTGKALPYADAKNDDRLRRWAETAYRATVRAHACDVLRSYLPAATLTNVGMFGVGQAFEYLISKFYSHELSEAKELGGAMHGELNQLIPSFVKRAQLNEYLVGTTAAAKALAAKDTHIPPVDTKEPVTLIDYDTQAEEKIIAAILYSHSRQPLAQLREIAGKLERGRTTVKFSTNISPNAATAATSSAGRLKTSITPSTSSAISASIAISTATAFSPRSARTSQLFTATTRRRKSKRRVSRTSSTIA